MPECHCNMPETIVKAQTIVVGKAVMLAVILSIGLLGSVAEAKKNTPPVATPAPAYRNDEGDVDSGWAEEIAKDTADNKADRDRLATVPPGSSEAQRIQRNIQERGDKAESYAERAPTNVPVLTAAADQALGNGDVARAQSRAEQAISAAAAETDPEKYAAKWPSAMNMRAKVAKAMEDFPTANAYALKVLEKFPKDPNALALFHETKGRAKGGAAPTPTPAAVPAPAFARAPIQAAPFVPTPAAPNVKSYLDRAATFIGMRDYRGAIDAAQRAAALDPSNPDPHTQQAVAWTALRNVSEAMLAISRAIERLTEGDPRLPTAYNTRASYKNKAGDYAGAATDASEAIKRDPVLAAAYYQRSLAQKAQGHKAESLADAKKAAELKPSDYQSMYELGLREMAEDGAPAAESALHQAWVKLLGKAGGGAYLFGGAMGAVFVLLAGYVFLFAKEGSAADRFKTRWFTPSSQPVTEVPDADAPPAQDGPYLPPMRGSGDADELEGRLVDGGKYRVVCMIGQGGMGTVYKAYDLALKRDVAIKCMNEALLPNERECARFVNEGRVVAKLRHPNIVAVHSLFKEGRRALIVFEHIEGDTLHHMLNESPGRRLESRRALAILAQLAAAVDHAHGEGVIHRDLKPPNVMVYGGDKVKVMDFGISRVVEHMEATKTKTIVGTPIYMAPEQCDGIVVRQSDIYALGIIAYEMLTGMLPFRDMGPMQLDKREGRFPAASALLPTLPAAVDEVFKKVLDPDPEKRYPRGRDFVEALDVALRQATPPGA